MTGVEYEHLRPLTVGEILDSSFRLYRRRFGALVGGCAVVVIPLALVQLAVNLSAQKTTTVSRIGGYTYRTTAVSGGTQLFLVLFGLFISGLNIALAQGAAMRILSDHYLGTETTWTGSLRYAFSRFGSLLWIVLLSGLAWIFGGMLGFIPGIYLYVSFAVVIPVRLIEDERGRRALSRSRALINGRWWPTFSTLLVVLLITTTLTLLATAFVGGSTFFLANTTSSTTARAVTGLLTAGVNVIVTPISAAVATIIYFDLRVRKEGFDLALMIQRLDLPAVAVAQPDAGTQWPDDRTTATTVPPFTPGASRSSPWAALDAIDADRAIDMERVIDADRAVDADPPPAPGALEPPDAPWPPP